MLTKRAIIRWKTKDHHLKQQQQLVELEKREISLEFDSNERMLNTTIDKINVTE